MYATRKNSLTDSTLASKYCQHALWLALNSALLVAALAYSLASRYSASKSSMGDLRLGATADAGLGLATKHAPTVAAPRMAALGTQCCGFFPGIAEDLTSLPAQPSNSVTGFWKGVHHGNQKKNINSTHLNQFNKWKFSQRNCISFKSWKQKIACRGDFRLISRVGSANENIWPAGPVSYSTYSLSLVIPEHARKLFAIPWGQAHAKYIVGLW